MDSAREDPAIGAFSASLAGLQAGMIATLWMLAWLGISAVWRRSSFWTAANLLASTFYGSAAIHSGFSTSTVSGLALYLFAYSTLGGLFAAVVRNRLPRLRLLLLSVVVAVAWYYLTFHGIWKTLSPLVTLLHAEQATLLGHVVYGIVLARFPRYLPQVSSATANELPAAVADQEPAAWKSPDS